MDILDGFMKDDFFTRKKFVAIELSQHDWRVIHKALGTPRSATGVRQSDFADELERLGREATPGPWAWDQRGEKINEWGLGVALAQDESPIAGHFDDENAQYVEYVCGHEAATCNYSDPALITMLRNNLDVIVQALRLAPSATGPMEERIACAKAMCPKCRINNFPEYQSDPTPTYWHEATECRANAIWLRGQPSDVLGACIDAADRSVSRG